MASLKNVLLESDRLILKPISLEYKEEIFREFNSEVTKFTYSKSAETIQETENFIHRAIRSQEEESGLLLVILNKNDLSFLGVCGVYKLKTRTAGFGIWIKKSAWGYGFGKEAIHRLKMWIDGAIEYDYLIYESDRENIASRKIPESLGGKIVSEYQRIGLAGNTLNLVEYHIYPSGS